MHGDAWALGRLSIMINFENDGVMNFELKDADNGGEVQVHYGEFYEGESSAKLAGNVGLPAGSNGFSGSVQSAFGTLSALSLMVALSRNGDQLNYIVKY